MSRQTSLHGLPYLPSENKVYMKFFWLGVVGVMNGLAFYFTWKNFVEYMNSGTTTSINTTTASLTDIYFPRLTCLYLRVIHNLY